MLPSRFPGLPDEPAGRRAGYRRNPIMFLEHEEAQRMIESKPMHAPLTSTVHLVSESEGWAMHTRPIDPALNGLVIRMCGFADVARAGLVRRELPFAKFPLILSFGAPYLLS